MATASLRSTREELLTDRSLRGAEFCRALSDATDAWLQRTAEEASRGTSRKLALLGVGGFGRRELCPFSDLDLVLVHDGRRDVAAVAEELWYPIWDQGVAVDHSVRRPKEVLRVAQTDLRVALGLLDARLIWGDEKIVAPLLSKVAQLWRSSLAAQFLPELEAQMDHRHRAEGDVAFLLEPNLKESHGGLRDAAVLRCLPSAAPRLEELVDLSEINHATDVLTAVRVELHRIAGRANDKMLLQDQDQVAERLGYGDADELCRAVSEAGRSIARLSDGLWRRRNLWAPGGKLWNDAPVERIEIEAGIVAVDGEICLASAAGLDHDASIGWRLAAVAAERDEPISLRSLHRLADELVPPGDPWAPTTTQGLLRLLRCGRRAIAPFESLDQVGVVVRLLPEWAQVRHYHQRNAYHRFTVDRHLLETCANAAESVGEVDDPDLLLLGALFHDLGKGDATRDHTELGVELAERIGPRLGLGQKRTDQLRCLVNHHLLLADTATRRDLADPKTIETVAAAVGDLSTLRLLAALTKADSLATGSSAWGAWKEHLVNQLVEATAGFFGDKADGDQLRRDPVVDHTLATLAERVGRTQHTEVIVDPPRVVVAAPDRPGLLADVAGTLALAGLSILSADVTSVGTVALDTFVVEASVPRWPDASTVSENLARVRNGDLDLNTALVERARTYAAAQRRWAARPQGSSVQIDNEGSAEATIIEIRSLDQIGLLYRLTSALAIQGLDVRAARVATIGGDVVDAFYVTAEGAKLHAGDRLDAVVTALSAVLDR